MRGLPFPAGAQFSRDESHENECATTPTTPTPGPGASFKGETMLIPIDPALDAIMFDTNGMLREGMSLPGGFVDSKFDEAYHPSTPNGSSSYYEKYSQGPQGDPFAPQPPVYFQEEERFVPLPHKPFKRKRKVRREEECGFCQGDDKKNKDGEPEVMITCVDCGRSGHPTCMDLGTIGDVLRSYDWKCVECKTCEVCSEKGDDERILFCDHCDRGWHMDCLRPPLAESPPGKWHCPLCPPLPPPFPRQQPAGEYMQEERVEIDPALAIDPALREPSVASSSHSVIIPSPKKKSRNKGKSRAITTDESEDVDVEEVLDEDARIPSTSKRNGRTMNTARRNKGRRRSPSMPISDDVPPPSPPLRPQKRVRVKMTTPVPQSPRERMVVRLRIPSKGKGKARESDDEEGKGLFDDVLNIEDRDTSKTVTLTGDKERFDKSRVAAEAKLIPITPSDPPDFNLLAGIPFRPLRSTIQQLQRQSLSSIMRQHSPTPSTPGTPSIPSLKYDTTGLRIRTIRFGLYDIQTWYDAPFPEEFSNIPEGRLWICEFCLKYMKSRFGAQRHRMKCKARHPPGDEIYRDGKISFFEVDGRKNKIYCQNLCLLSKMFLDHKSLFYDVEPFLFYVMTETDDTGGRFIGYFSKEKRSPKDLNLSCIMTLPIRQRKGWGNLLIDFSYLLSKKERRVGTPERPLSALGALGYRNYWTLAIMRYLKTAPDKPRMEDISSATSMTIEDIYATLTELNLIMVKEMRPAVRPSPGQSIKITRGRKNGVARRHLARTQTKDEDKSNNIVSIPTDYEISWDRDVVTQYLDNWGQKGYLTLKPEKLKWSPFLLSRTTNAIDNNKSLSTSVAKTPDSLRPSSSSEVANTLLQASKAVSESPAEISTSISGLSQSALESNGMRALNGLEQLADLALLTAGVHTSDTTQHFAPSLVAPESPTPNRGRTNGRSITIPIRPITPPHVNPSAHDKQVSRSRTPPSTPSATALSTIVRRSNSQSSQALPDWSVNGSNHSNTSPNAVIDDAQFAKRLAQEIEKPKRLLRSSSIISQALASTTPQKSADVSKSTPKKSHTAGSPSRSISPSVLTRSTTRSMTRKVSQDELSSKPVSRMLRGRTANRTEASWMLSSPVRSSSRLNGAASSPIASAAKAISTPRNLKLAVIPHSPVNIDVIDVHDEGTSTEHISTNVDESVPQCDPGLDQASDEVIGITVVVNGHHANDDYAYKPTLDDVFMENNDQSVKLAASNIVDGSDDVKEDAIDIDAEGDDEDAEGEPDPEIDV